MKIKLRLLLTLLLAGTILPEILTAQYRLQGMVQEAGQDTPIPFVNIGIPDAAIGTVSDEDGKFILEVPDTLKTVRFSAIGYRTLDISIAELLQQKTIEMQVQAVVIPVIELSAKRLEADRILGNPVYSNRRGIGFFRGQLGAEVGVKIPVRKETWLKEARFAIRDRGSDTLLFRVNIYRMEGDRVGQRINPDNILIQSLLEKGELVVDLSPHNLVVDHDLFLSLEWIKGYRANEILFKAAPGRRGSAIYSRPVSQAPLERHPRKLHLGFYFIGKETQ